MPTYRTKLTGIVQGVGFRPFVARTAATYHIRGTVANKGPYVEIYAQGSDETCRAFLRAVKTEPPARAIILHMETEELQETAPTFPDFQIIESAREQGPIYVSPDIATCDACLRELYDPENPRYLHPFINCTNCGPRLTIEEAAPYDRERTTMKDFPMCDACAKEYHDPTSRRYDAQPVCCNHCGPEVFLLKSPSLLPADDAFPPPRAQANLRADGVSPSGFKSARFTFPKEDAPSASDHESNFAITIARRALIDGKILAIKGIGGFHLACDATNEQAVATLRKRKHRPKKPFALMAADIETVEQVAIVETEEQRKLLTGHQKPILLLKKKFLSPRILARLWADGVFPSGIFKSAGFTFARGHKRPLSAKALSVCLSRGNSPSAIDRKNNSANILLAPNVAPGNPKLGLMLPYAPLQLLLFHYPPDGLDAHMPRLLIMTSGNPSGAPICHTDEEAAEALGSIADLILTHNRRIRLRADDTVLDWTENHPYPIRRSRGFAPLPVFYDTTPEHRSDTNTNSPRLQANLRVDGVFPPGIFKSERFTFPEGNAPSASDHEQNSATTPQEPHSLAIGGELKNTFALARGPLLYPSAYVGDTTDLRTILALRDSIPLMQSLLDIHPQLIACDLHPRYNTTALAHELAKTMHIPLLPVQHHYAHILSCLAENDCHETVLGIALDGTGYGPDGTIWGGEILAANLSGYTRLASIDPFDQAGGDKAPKEPYRIAIALLKSANLANKETIVQTLHLCTEQEYNAQTFLLDRHLNTVTSTSAGRLFDAMSALLGLCQHPTFEGEAPMALQAAAEAWASEHPGNVMKSQENPLPLPNKTRTEGASLLHIPTQELFTTLAKRYLAHLASPAPENAPNRLAYEFHARLANLLTATCAALRTETNITIVALSGGVFQNTLLLRLTKTALQHQGFTVLTHHQVPPNDGGLSLGQAAAAQYYLNHPTP